MEPDEKFCRRALYWRLIHAAEQLRDGGSAVEMLRLGEEDQARAEEILAKPGEDCPAERLFDSLNRVREALEPWEPRT